jgi:hypothetical protein
LEGYAEQSGRNGAPPGKLDSGLASPSSLISLNGKPKISRWLLHSEKNGWQIASQTLSQGRIKAASVCRRALLACEAALPRSSIECRPLIN